MKIKGDLSRYDTAESKYGNQNALLPTTFKGERFKVKNYVLSLKKKVNIVLKLLYTVQNMKIM